jgi:hypothetical protein
LLELLGRRHDVLLRLKTWRSNHQTCRRFHVTF